MDKGTKAFKVCSRVTQRRKARKDKIENLKKEKGGKNSTQVFKKMEQGLYNMVLEIQSRSYRKVFYIIYGKDNEAKEERDV